MGNEKTKHSGCIDNQQVSEEYKRVRFELDVVAWYITFSAIKFSFVPVFIFFHAKYLQNSQQHLQHNTKLKPLV